MDTFRIRALAEEDIRAIVDECGGTVAHPDVDRRMARGSDFILGGAAIELKLIEEDGLEKSERQSKLAQLFGEEVLAAPVVVLDRARLSELGQRTYDRILEGPIKGAVASARQQLKQTRAERPDTNLSVLWIVNNGYTALNHDELTALVARRVRNDTRNIDGIVVGGCYFHSDGFDSFFLWPLSYIPVRLQDFPAFDTLHDVWNRFAENFMTKVVRGEVGPEPLKGPVIDAQFECDGVTYVKPAPPIGGKSEFFRNGRPRRNSSGLTQSSRVALTFPALSTSEWKAFRHGLPEEPGLKRDYQSWLRHEQEAQEEGHPLKPFVRVPITFEGWQQWQADEGRPAQMRSVYEYANHIFQQLIQPRLTLAQEMTNGGLLPSRYVLLVTQEIGMDANNDLSSIAKVRERVDGSRKVEPLVNDVRAFHKHALALACAYAVREEVDAVRWMRDRRYAWA